MGKSRLLATMAFSATFFALGVIALGAFTRLIDAGLGCPDWPGCYGHLTVPVGEKARRLATEGHFVVYKAWADSSYEQYRVELLPLQQQ